MFNFTPVLVNGLIRILIVWQCVVTPVYGESAKRNQLEGRPKHFVMEGKTWNNKSSVLYGLGDSLRLKTV